MGLKWPWEDSCKLQVVIDDKVYTFTGSYQKDNILSLYVTIVCEYQAADGSITTVEHTRVLWVLDFPW
ncbi:MAG: hypothetical protein AUG51_25505 [Acidobacteria bacterium 13_1_20CM_3_53_8]|nr:MAG: hypothetical protein AUG51_25505 [Acidobacteria bacterium 13_1_20CM_3_53_8]